MFAAAKKNDRIFFIYILVFFCVMAILIVSILLKVIFYGTGNQ